MLLGKRPRPPIRRTMSITEFTIDLNSVEAEPPFDPRNVIRDLQNLPAVGPSSEGGRRNPVVDGGGAGGVNIPDGFDPRLLSTISPRPNNYRRNSGDFAQTPHFLRSCGLCNRRLAPGRDIYMYRGDTAFCSLECRQQQMSQDERKEKCSSSFTSSNIDHPSSSSSSTVESDHGGATIAAS